MPTKDPVKLKAKKQRWYQKNRKRILASNASSKASRIRDGHLRRKFGFGIEAWEKEFDAQGRKCAACGAKESAVNTVGTQITITERNIFGAFFAAHVI